MDRVCPVGRANMLFGSTNDAGSVPICLAPSVGPVYVEGRLVLSLSFQGGEPLDLAIIADEKKAIARYRLWDDASEDWFDGSPTVLRFECADIVMRIGVQPVPVWAGVLDTSKRVVLVPDFDDKGFAVNQSHDLRWKVA